MADDTQWLPQRLCGRARLLHIHFRISEERSTQMMRSKGNGKASSIGSLLAQWAVSAFRLHYWHMRAISGCEFFGLCICIWRST